MRTFAYLGEEVGGGGSISSYIRKKKTMWKCVENEEDIPAIRNIFDILRYPFLDEDL